MVLLERIRLSLLFCAALFCDAAWAYPQFVGYGYTSCSTCHFNPDGGSTLTDYGRAIWANTIAGRTFISKATSDEELGARSGFLGKIELPQWIRAAVNVRDLVYVSDLTSDAKQSRHLLMVADGHLVLKFGERDQVWLATSGGLVPYSQVVNRQLQTSYDLGSREHYIGWRPNKILTLYLGKTDAAFGTRIPDHRAFSRVNTGQAQNDQTYGLATHVKYKKIEGTLQFFVGDFLQHMGLRQKGVTGYLEFEAKKNFRIGLSQYWSTNAYFRRLMTALHARLGMGHGHSMLIEVGSLRPQAKFDGAKPTQGAYLFSQFHQKLVRGLHLMETIEAYRSDFASPTEWNTRFAPGIQWYPWQRVELRTELTYNRNLGGETRLPGTWDFTGQIHLAL